MRKLEARIAALEAGDLNRRGGATLVLVAVHAALTAEQRVQAEAATREGREVFVIEVVPAASAGPDKAGKVQA